jgi:hypothetical protein
MGHQKIKGKTVLIGLSSDGKCVYSEVISAHKYYDGAHPWDSKEGVKGLRLAVLKGFLFGRRGELFQEFENQYDLETGQYKDGWCRHADDSSKR